jgi:outer membrane protein assembly factor BamE (lipoprotein component of BamABCDE complex)
MDRRRFYEGLPMRILTVAAALALSALLAGCDPQRVSKLEEGVATEADVRREFGEPVTVVKNADGSQVLEYPRQPEGWTNYRITLGADGKMSSLRQLLNADNFARVRPGMSQTEVLDLLGRPAARKRYDLKQEEVLEWRFRPVNEAKVFSVTFDAAQRVTGTATHDDPRDAMSR